MRFRGCGTPWRHLIGSQVTSATLVVFRTLSPPPSSAITAEISQVSSFSSLHVPAFYSVTACLLAISSVGFYFAARRLFLYFRPRQIPRFANQVKLSHCRDVMRGLPLTCGETPWSPDGTSHSARQHSTQQQAQFAALHSLHSPAVSHARASLCLLSSNFLTPERFFFSSPATF